MSVELAEVTKTTVSEVVDKIYTQLKDKISSQGDISADEVLELIYLSMETVAKVKEFSGAQKKKVVMRVADKLVEELPEGDLKTGLTVALKLLLSPMIDGIVDFVKKRFDLNQDGHISGEEVKKGCKSVFCCMRK